MITFNQILVIIFEFLLIQSNGQNFIFNRNLVCPNECKCSKYDPQCMPQVPIIVDGCNCCKICARQMGEPCSQRNLCDISKNLICYYPQDAKKLDSTSYLNIHSLKYEFPKLGIKPTWSNSIGSCWKSEGKSCAFKGKIMKHSTYDRPNCRQLCFCNDGILTCIDECQELESRRPSNHLCNDIIHNSTNHDKNTKFIMKLVQPLKDSLSLTNGKCCNEWMCVPETSLLNHEMTNKEMTKTQQCDQKEKKTTAWSTCSKKCDLGISIRSTTDNINCQNITQVRLCLLRPCEDLEQNTSLNRIDEKNCKPMITSKRPGFLKYELDNNTFSSIEKENSGNLTICKSSKPYQLNFCTQCRKNYCCLPSKSRMKKVSFDCSDRRKVVHYFELIKECFCNEGKCNDY